MPLTASNPFTFVEYLTESRRLRNDMMVAGGDRPLGGMIMDEASTKKTQLMALLMTVCVVGGALVYAMSA